MAAFTLTTPGVPAAYTLVTANDAPERDPTSWVLSCATPGSSTYTPMDTITAHDTSTYGRYVSYGAFMIVVPPPGAPKPPPAPPGTMVPYIGCEFRVTANAGNSDITQLADLTMYGPDGIEILPTVGDPSFSSTCNSPGSEGVSAALDANPQTKWLCL